MPHLREVKTCNRCRHFKRRCDLIKPSCSRCLQAGTRCSFDTSAAAAAIGAATTAAAAASSNMFSLDDYGNSDFLSMSPSPPSTIYSASPLTGGLISPSASVESPEPPSTAPATARASPLDEDIPSDTASAPVAPRVVRKRKRNCLSCLRCHRLKVKCDKELPCRRCRSSGNGGDCYYSYNKGPNGGKFPCPIAPVSLTRNDGPGSSSNNWTVAHKVRGSSHWRDLMAKIGSIEGVDPTALNTALQGIATNACLANFTLPGNFPFGTPGAAKYFAKDAVTRLLEAERPNYKRYLDRYINTLDAVNPVLDLANFNQEIAAYWKDPGSVTLCWLSQFLMALGLGCFMSVDAPHQATELMMAAEACLMQTPFMFRPTFVALKALTLMVVAKQVCNATCWSVDSCWSLLGLLVRVSYMFGLPMDQLDSTDSALDFAERSERRKLWLTILYLDTKISMCTGMPPLTCPDAMTFNAMAGWDQPEGLHKVLYQSMPTVLTVLAKLNSNYDQLSYQEMLQYNMQLRELITHAQQVCDNPLQRITIDIFLRRFLMVMHRPFAMHPDGVALYPESYWSSLECSLALLIHYRELWCASPAERLNIVGQSFILDFFSAALTIFLHVLSPDALLSGNTAMGCQIPPRQIILELLRSCIDIWNGESNKSVCYRTGYELLLAIFNMIPET